MTGVVNVAGEAISGPISDELICAVTLAWYSWSDLKSSMTAESWVPGMVMRSHTVDGSRKFSASVYSTM